MLGCQVLCLSLIPAARSSADEDNVVGKIWRVSR